MKVVVLKGSPQKKGITAKFVDEIFKDFEVDYHEYQAYDNDIKACIACNYCFTHENECVIKDQFQEMISDISDADLIVLASPLHFSAYTGKLLSMISRFQYLFALKYQHHKPIPFKEKYGLAIITGGNDYPNMFEATKLIDHIIFDHINANEVKRINIKKTDDYEIEKLFDIYQNEILEIREYIKEIEKLSY